MLVPKAISAIDDIIQLGNIDILTAMNIIFFILITDIFQSEEEFWESTMISYHGCDKDVTSGLLGIDEIINTLTLR